MQRGTIAVQTENIFPIIKKFLYSDHEIFLRELVSNAVDATTKLRVFANRGQFGGELGDDRISITINDVDKTLTISDKGIGMTEEEVLKYLNQIAFSSATEFLETYKDSGYYRTFWPRFLLCFYGCGQGGSGHAVVQRGLGNRQMVVRRQPRIYHRKSGRP